MSEQEEMRKKLRDLKASLSNRWIRWDDWERKFIVNVTLQLEQSTLNITPKQYQKICALWERSLG